MKNHLVLGMLAAALVGSSAFAAEAIEIPRGQRQLFLDDYAVAKLASLHRTMHSPEKRGAVIVPDQPWEKWIQTRSRPFWDEKQQIFKLWLITAAPKPQYSGSAYAESKDGIHWVKPALGQKEYDGSTANNFITTDPKLPWGPNCIESVVYDPNDSDPARRYKGLMGAEYRVPVVSADGIHWSQLDAAKLASGDEGNLCFDPATGLFIATLKTFVKHGRAHAVWTSKDFVHWTRLPDIFQADDEDQRLAVETIQARLADATLQQPVCNNPADYHADIYNLGLFRYEGLYIGLPAVYYATGKDAAGTNTDGFHWIQLACTRDLKTWQRLGNRKAFIGPSPVGQGAYDLTQLLPPSAPVVRGDELWFYYTGLKYREPPQYADAKQGAVCLAVLRRDGFISLDAAEQPGTLLTKPFVLNGSKLCVNADAGGGTVHVEVLSADAKPLAASQPVAGDQLHATLAWAKGDLTGLKGQTVQLQFTLHKAKLYSFWIDE